MDRRSTQAPGRGRRIRALTGVALTSVIIVVIVLVAVPRTGQRVDGIVRIPVSGYSILSNGDRAEYWQGCLTVPSNLYTDVRSPIALDASISFDPCMPDAGPGGSVASVGTRVRVELLGPSFPGRIAPLAADGALVNLPRRTH